MSGADVRRYPGGIKSDDAEADEQEAIENKNAAEEEVPPDPSAEQDSANEHYHQESHKSTEQHDNQQGRARFRDLDRHASWRDVYRACGVEQYGHE